ncbi:hypothetical protein ACP4OV_008877 [Aristida adscensionis]
MEKGPLQIVMLCALILTTMVKDCLASNVFKGNSWAFPSSPFDIHPPQLSSLSDKSVSVQPMDDSGNDWQWEYASHSWNSDLGGLYYGVEATSDVYGFRLRVSQMSGSIVLVSNTINGQTSTEIAVGWHVLPAIYQDSNTHFFTYWRVYHANGESQCYNTNCSSGFTRTSGSNIAPGDSIYPSSRIAGRVQYITLRVFKDSATGDWHVHCGFNSAAQSVGYFPKEVIPLLSDSKQVNITFGGFIAYTGNDSNIPMGSGNVPPNNAAKMSHLQLIDIQGGNHVIDKDLPIISAIKCYPVSPIVDGQFFYGGPNNC